jgi:hypothetical protein
MSGRKSSKKVTLLTGHMVRKVLSDDDWPNYWLSTTR